MIVSESEENLLNGFFTSQGFMEFVENQQWGRLIKIEFNPDSNDIIIHTEKVAKRIDLDWVLTSIKEAEKLC